LPIVCADKPRYGIFEELRQLGRPSQNSHSKTLEYGKGLMEYMLYILDLAIVMPAVISAWFWLQAIGKRLRRVSNL